MAALRFRNLRPDEEPWFRRHEFETAWENLPPQERCDIPRDRFRVWVDETNELLLARPGMRRTVAEDEAGAIVGYVWFGPQRRLDSGEEVGWIYSIRVLPEHRGRGYGRMLMLHADELAREAGYAHVGLMVAEHNEPARKLYETTGFSTLALLMLRRVPPG